MHLDTAFHLDALTEALPNRDRAIAFVLHTNPNQDEHPRASPTSSWTAFTFALDWENISFYDRVSSLHTAQNENAFETNSSEEQNIDLSMLQGTYVAVTDTRGDDHLFLFSPKEFALFREEFSTMFEELSRHDTQKTTLKKKTWKRFMPHFSTSSKHKRKAVTRRTQEEVVQPPTLVEEKPQRSSTPIDDLRFFGDLTAQQEQSTF